MNSTSRFFASLLVVSSFFLLSMYLPAPIPEIRGLCVNNFETIIGQADKEAALLEFAKAEGFNYLLLYNLSQVNEKLYDLTDVEESKALAQFIKKAKMEHGVLEIGATGETAKSFETIYQYNALYAGSDFSEIDVYNMEFEFWDQEQVSNYYWPKYISKQNDTYGREIAFDYYWKELLKLKTLAKSSGVKCETYIGEPTLKQCERIGEVCDRVLIHYYSNTDLLKKENSIFQNQDYRLPALAPESGVLNILPIFSNQKKKRGSWFEDQNQSQINYAKNGLEDRVGKWKEHIHIQGGQWSSYSKLK